MHPILMYHGVGTPAPHGEPRYTVTEEGLRAQLELLTALNLAAVPLAQLLAGGDGIVLSFDDGEASVLRLAAPLLTARGWVGVAYVTSDWIGTAGYLAASDVRELAARGWTIGSHGRTHRFLSDLDDDALGEELRASRAALEELLGTPVGALSLPGGRGDRRVLRAASAAGYTSVATSAPGVNRTLTPTRLERLVVHRGDDLKRFGNRVSGHRPTLAVEAATTGALGFAKQLLGNQRYARLRQGALARWRRR